MVISPRKLGDVIDWNLSKGRTQSHGREWGPVYLIHLCSDLPPRILRDFLECTPFSRELQGIFLHQPDVECGSELNFCGLRARESLQWRSDEPTHYLANGLEFDRVAIICGGAEPVHSRSKAKRKKAIFVFPLRSCSLLHCILCRGSYRVTVARVVEDRVADALSGMLSSNHWIVDGLTKAVDTASVHFDCSLSLN